MDNSFENLFNKEWVLSSCQAHDLPSPSLFFLDNPWQILRMIDLKAQLNTVKSKLNHYDLKDWHEHTKSLNPAGNVIHHIRKNYSPEYCSQAWLKFYEMSSKFPLIPESILQDSVEGSSTLQFNSMHLCEAPGAFISSLNHYIKLSHPDLQWKWRATSLNPHHEGNSTGTMINTDCLIMNSLPNWTWLADNTGNLISQENILFLRKWIRDDLGKVHLMTGDGSIDCQLDPGEQENLVADLHFAEILAGVLCLDQGGSFLLKIFTFFEHATICHLFLLACLFGRVSLIKPCTSKEGNSEIYVVCTDFRGLGEGLEASILTLLGFLESKKDKALFPLNCIPESFLEDIFSAQEFFLRFQIEVIEKNISWYPANDSLHQIMEYQRNQIVQEWIEHFPIAQIKSKYRIYKGSSRGKQTSKNLSNLSSQTGLIDGGYEEGSFLQKMERISLSPQNKLINFRTDLQKFKIWSETILGIEPLVYKEGIVMGKPYGNILSSRFCMSQVLRLRQELRGILHKLHSNSKTRKRAGDDHFCEEETPRSKRSKHFWGKFTDNVESVRRICFREGFEDFAIQNDFQITRSALGKLLRVLKGVQKGESLFLCQYSMLSRLSIGFIFGICRLFSNVFISAKLDGNERGIMLEGYKGNVLQGPDGSLENLEALIMKGDGSRMVLEVFPMNYLCDPHYFKPIVSYNMMNVISSLERFIQLSL